MLSTTDIFFQILPLYILIALGFVGGRFFHIDANQLAKIVIQLVIPLTFFNIIAKLEFSLLNLSLPLIIFAIAIINSVIFYNFGKLFLKNSRTNMLAAISGLANAGYFGLPIAMILFDEKTVSIYAIAFMGLNFFEATFAYYYAHRASSGIKQSITRVLKMPMFWGMFFGIVASYFSYQTPQNLERFFANLTGCYATLGMILIGIGISKIKHLKFDWFFISSSFVAKFIGWPVLSLIFIFLDRHYFELFNYSGYYKVIFLISIMPMAANASAIASFFNLHSENVATAVFLSTIFALFYLPFVIVFAFSLL